MTGREAFENIVYQKRDNGYISDIYRNDIEQVYNDLDALKLLANMFDYNTLFRVMPYEKAKAIADYIDKQNEFHPEIKETLMRISEETWNDTQDNMDEEKCVRDVRPADIPYDEYMKVVRENEELKETIVKLVKKLNGCKFFD